MVTTTIPSSSSTCVYKACTGSLSLSGVLVVGPSYLMQSEVMMMMEALFTTTIASLSLVWADKSPLSPFVHPKFVRLPIWGSDISLHTGCTQGDLFFMIRTLVLK